MKNKLFACIVIFLFITTNVYNQTFKFNNKVIRLEGIYKVRISNGTEIIGKIVGYDENRGITIQFSDENSYTYLFNQIVSISEFKQSPVFGGGGFGIPYGVLYVTDEYYNKIYDDTFLGVSLGGGLL